MARLRRELSLFDVTSIVIGGIVGADIYIASSITSGLIGPFSILVWLIAGAFAAVLALVFAYNSFYAPRTGGSFGYATMAFDKFYGFLAGWSLWVAEVVSLAVFPIAFTSYLQFFVKLSFPLVILIQGLFIFGLTAINIIGVKRAGKVNDALTMIKLAPLFLLLVFGLGFFAGHPDILQSNYSPLAPLGLDNFGTALVLIFWAFAGFELAALPAGEIKNPRRTIPRAIILGMVIVTAFYMVTNFVVYGTVHYTELAKSTTPLVLSSIVVMGAIGALVMSVGALFSVSGSDEAGVLGTARLSYAMAISGLFPKIFARLHKKFGTPYMALIIQAVIAFVASLFYGIMNLITFATFNLAFAYLLSSLALLALKKGSRIRLFAQEIIPWAGVAISLYLLYSTSVYDKLLGIFVIFAGVLIYVFFSPKEDIRHLKRLFFSEEAVLARRLEHRDRFLANFIRIAHRLYKKIRPKEKSQMQIEKQGTPS